LTFFTVAGSAVGFDFGCVRTVGVFADSDHYGVLGFGGFEELVKGHSEFVKAVFGF
jgi:hypothetical protein